MEDSRRYKDVHRTTELILRKCVLLKMIYRFNAVSTWLSVTFFTELEKKY